MRRGETRRGVVLFITLAILTMLGTVVFLFLQRTGELKKSVRQNHAIIQTNLILGDISRFLKSRNFNQDDIYYGAGVPVSLDLGPVGGMLTIDSAQSRLNINAVLKAVAKHQEALNAFLVWMERQKVKHPYLLLALMLDTIDPDLYERGRHTEIRLQEPWFQNGSIRDTMAMRKIFHYYKVHSGDNGPSLQAWEEVFGYEGATLDLNYATIDQLTLLYPDLPIETLDRLAAHDTRWQRPDELPIDDPYRSVVLQPHMGITPVLATQTVAVSIDFNTTGECRGHMGFWMGLKKKKITHLSLSAVLCQ